ncbi:non-ribosomal peptide synthetase [Chamaesiphon sp. VAR_48_metabat_135_sub]|uniref:non-ribosomal peptide synthetase n=1 Tax=Chamaesiphon sp. VAR_48_metabat_135_sub TaxID=2964699 RepID=UPI00286A8AC3|nr:non-ribosomal peptide synthetase [Chamaesiphon sp. VAR_48_metabat_135_sub]
MAPVYQTFSCFLIGRESFLIPCAKHLLDCGHQILGIISTGKSIDTWTDSHGIATIDPTADVLGFLSQQPFDYLFSISNLSILSPEILALPRQFAINCHDGPLPKYGGMNAPSWAIINQEKVHGITWHQMTALVDGGDILKQISFDLDERETGATLNSKCYETIVSSFSELIEEIATGQVSLTQQDSQARSYFTGSRKPSPGCILNWHQSALSIDATIRALDFGRYENFLGMPKLAIANKIIIISKAEILNCYSGLMPGTIVAIESDRSIVATTSQDLSISHVQTLDGEPLSMLELVHRLKLKVGDRFTDLDSDIAQQIEILEKGLVKHECFWVQRLATLNPIAVPYSSKDNSFQPKFASQDWTIPSAITEFLVDRQPTWNLADFLVAVVITYLSRISQQDCFDIAIKYPELDSQLIGVPDLFVDRVPARIDLNPEQGFAEAFESIDRELKVLKQHQTYPRDIVLRYPELQPLAKIGFEDRRPVSINRVKTLSEKPSISTHGLTFIIPDRGNNCCCYYDSNLLDEDRIDRMLEQLTVFIQGIVDNPDQSLANLPLLSAVEAHQILVEWNDTQVNFGVELCIHQLFESQVEKSPDNIAVVFEAEEITYRQLNNQANQLAHYLKTLGVTADVLVGICVDRSIDTIVGILGILKAEGAYVPLDPDYPQERLAFIVADAAMPIILTQSQLVEKLSIHQAQVICLDIDLPDIQKQCAQNLVTEVKPNNLAYVIYTSGSTGKPKGVLIEHHSLVNYTIAAQIQSKLTQIDRVLQFTSLNFDVSAEEIYTCLTAGATLILRNDAMLTSIQAFLQQCQEWEISVTSLPTAYWHELTARLDADKLTIPPSWRLAIIGGEQAAPARLLEWQRSVGMQVRLINAYGPTEATISALMCDLSKFDADMSMPEIPIGRPIANTQVYILDKHRALCPIGIAGELYLGGAGLARGYLNQPELTAQKFISNPFNPDLSARLYQTGDLVKYLPNGNLQFLGRLDEQVKIRGFRIELGEIETVLNAHPAVQEAIVIDRDEQSGQKSLAAYLVPKQQHLQMQWWPSIGEYPLYDELLYHSMTTDLPRNQAYQQAIDRVVENKIVVDIGTGKDALLARFCIAAGAKKVYAIEASETAFQQATMLIEQLGLQDKIIPIYGYSTEIELPELVDVCLSEIIGTIGGSEGVAPLLNDARHLLKPNGLTIPHRCVTKIAAITLPDELLNNPSFQELTGHYTQQIFDLVGQPFDLRLCVKNLPQTSLISDSGIFEDLVFTTATASEYRQDINLSITKPARFDGFLLWLNLYTAPDIVIDNLAQEYSWLPVYFPIFYPGIDVIAGDRIEATCAGYLSDNNINPDYRIEGRLIGKNGEVVSFYYDSLHHQHPILRNPFYKLLFPDGKIKIDKYLSNLSPKNIRAYLSLYLPDYMLPSDIFTVEEFPLTPNGKIDRRALLALNPPQTTSGSSIVAPRNPTEEILTKIWQEVLGLKQIDINDNFFDLGGHSLFAIQLFTKIEQQLKIQLPLSILINSPTVVQLAEQLTKTSQNRISATLLLIQPQGSKPPFFCIHSLDPCLLFYQSLVKNLGTDLPFYGIQPYDLDNQMISFPTIEEMAIYYLWEVRSIQPHGPYYFGGFSFGGYVALEMAHQLKQQGEEVALLAIFDTPAPGVEDGVSVSEQSRRFGKLLLKYGHKFLYYKLMNRLEMYRRSVRDTWRKNKKQIRDLFEQNLLIKTDLQQPNRLTSSQQQNWTRSVEINERASYAYDPDVYPGKITLFQAGYSVNTADLSQGWERLAGMGLETIEIPGDHASIFNKTNAVFLARELNKCIEKTLTD